MNPVSIAEQTTNELPTPKTLQAQLKTVYYDLVMLALADAAYQYESSKDHTNEERAQAVTQVIENLQPLPSPDPLSKDTLPGYWHMDWGPAISKDNSNLLYLASWRQGQKPTNTSEQQGTPDFFVVGIRGTDTSTGLVALVQQTLQDVGVLAMVEWVKVLKEVPSLCGRDALPKDECALGKIARGSADGFKKLVGLTAPLTQNTTQSVNLINALKQLRTDKVPVMVTGHSLGGCQTQAIAAYLAWQLDHVVNTPSQSVIPVAFAPPTLGNASFVTHCYDKLFATGRYWDNQLDLVPQAFWNLQSAAEDFWTSYRYPDGSSGPELPCILKDAIRINNWDIKRHHYAHPNQGFERLNQAHYLPTLKEVKDALNLGQEPKSISGIQMLEWQHFPPAYHKFIREAYTQSQVVDYRLPDIKS